MKGIQVPPFLLALLKDTRFASSSCWLETNCCHKKLSTPELISRLYSPQCYQTELGQLVQRAKEDKSFKLARDAADYVAHYARNNLQEASWDLIVAIPPQKKTIQERGFHLPLLFAQMISREIHRRRLTYREQTTLRWHWRSSAFPQKFLSLEERQKNREHCFSSRKRSLQGASILIVDDVISSGTTLFQAAQALQKRNPDRIEAFCLAHSHHHATAL